MPGWVRALQNSFTNVSSTQVGSRAKTYLFSDRCKLAVSNTRSTSRPWLGYEVANDQGCILYSAIVSTHPETERASSLSVLKHPGTRIT